MLPTMLRFKLMSRLGLAEPLIRLARSVERSNRRAASKQVVSNSDLVARPSGDMTRPIRVLAGEAGRGDAGYPPLP